MDFIAVRSDAANKESFRFQGVSRVIDGCGVYLRLSQRESKLRQMRDLVDLSARRLEQYGCCDSPVNIRSGPFVSASSARACECCAAMSVSIAEISLDSPSCPNTTARNSGTSSGADPNVINGSRRARS